MMKSYIFLTTILFVVVDGNKYDSISIKNKLPKNKNTLFFNLYEKTLVNKKSIENHVKTITFSNSLSSLNLHRQRRNTDPSASEDEGSGEDRNFSERKKCLLKKCKTRFNFDCVNPGPSSSHSSIVHSFSSEDVSSSEDVKFLRKKCFLKKCKARFNLSANSTSSEDEETVKFSARPSKKSYPKKSNSLLNIDFENPGPSGTQVSSRSQPVHWSVDTSSSEDENFNKYFYHTNSGEYPSSSTLCSDDDRDEENFGYVSETEEELVDEDVGLRIDPNAQQFEVDDVNDIIKLLKDALKATMSK